MKNEGVTDESNGNIHFALEMASSMGTYTTHSSTHCDESQSHNKHGGDLYQDMKLMTSKKPKVGEKGSLNSFSLNAAENDSGNDSSDFEDNDFDALVGEFFWYLREKEKSKATPSRQGKISIATPERMPRATYGSGSVLTLRNSAKKDADYGPCVDASKEESKTDSSLVFDDVTTINRIGHEKENVARTQCEESENETVLRFDNGILTQTTIVLDETEASESTNDLDNERGEISLEDSRSSPDVLKEESREDDNTKSEQRMTPSRDDSWNSVWKKKGLMGRTPTPIKNFSSRNDNNNASSLEKTSHGKDLGESSKKKKVLTWPPPKTVHSCPPLSSPVRPRNAANVEDEGSENAVTLLSPEFDPDMELSKILDEPPVPEVSDSENELIDPDLELREILDDSLGVNKAESFIERQKLILGDDESTSMASMKATPLSDLVNNDSVPEYVNKRDEDSDSVIASSNSVVAETSSNSVVAETSSNSVVAETSSVVFDSLSPNSVLGRESPSSFLMRDATCSTQKCTDPDGYVMDVPDGYVMDDVPSRLSSPESVSNLSFDMPSPPHTEGRGDIDAPAETEVPLGNKHETIEVLQTSRTSTEPVSLSSPVSVEKSHGAGNRNAVSTIESRLSFGSLPSAEHRVTTVKSPSSASVSSRKTYESFSALSISTIEKKPGTPPNSTNSTMMLKTSIVFDSPMLEDSRNSVSSQDSLQAVESHLMNGVTSPSRQWTSASGEYSTYLDGADEAEDSVANDDPKVLDDSGCAPTPAETSDASFVVPATTEEESLLHHSAGSLGADEAVTSVNNSGSVSAPSESSNDSFVVPTPTEVESLLHHLGGSLGSNEAAASVNNSGSASTPSETSDDGFVVPTPSEVNALFRDSGGSIELEFSSSDDDDDDDADTVASSEKSDLSRDNDLTEEVTALTTESPSVTEGIPDANESSEGIPSIQTSIERSPLVEPEEATCASPPPMTPNQTSHGETVKIEPVVSSFPEEVTSSPSKATLSSQATNEFETRSPMPKAVDESMATKETTESSPFASTPVRKPNNKFSNILSQWEEKSAHSSNGHFLSPPAHDTPPRNASLRPKSPPRRKSTSQFKSPLKQKEESTLPKWTPPPRSSARRKSIDIETITIPNKGESSKAKESPKAGQQKTVVSYWNGMIQKSNEPKKEWASRPVTYRESTEPADLMLTVPTQVPSSTLANEANLSTTNSNDTNDDDIPCTCNESAFSGNDQLMEFFLPKLGMAHTCGRRNPPILIDSDPIGLHHILRPWQVDFLRSCDIYRGDQLVKACKKRAGSLAGAMRTWRLERGMSCPKSVSCGMALHIWSRTCKYYVRTIRRQMAEGMVEVEPPTLGDVMTTCDASKDTSFVSSVGGDEEQQQHNDDESSKDYFM